jgi:hypothetical protein
MRGVLAFVSASKSMVLLSVGSNIEFVLLPVARTLLFSPWIMARFHNRENL